MTDLPERHSTALDASTKLAVERTRLALDRTLMAWIRSAISLITFGFGIYKVLDTRATVVATRIGHREFCLIMIGVGLLSLVLGTYEHRQGTKQLALEYPTAPRCPSHVRVLAVLVSGLGLAALLTMILG